MRQKEKRKKMNTRITYIGIAAIAFAAGVAHANVVIDLGYKASGISGGNYNDIYGDSRDAIAGDYTLVDFDTGLTAHTLTLSANIMTAGWGDSGNGYEGVKPASLDGYAATALDDGLFLNNSSNPDPVLTFAFSNLVANQQYEFLVYGGRTTSVGQPLYAALTVGTLGAGADMEMASTLNNATDTISFVGTSTADGLLSVDFSAGGTGDAAALNFISMEAIPEPAALGLIAVFGGGILFVRRRFMI
jgi:hypothetical protein